MHDNTSLRLSQGPAYTKGLRVSAKALRAKCDTSPLAIVNALTSVTATTLNVRHGQIH
jgi:hypothetical protein